MASNIEIVTEPPAPEMNAHKAGIFAQLDEAFAKLFAKSDDKTYLSEQVSESGELRIDDICKDPSVLEITPDTDIIRRAIYKSKSLRVCSESTVKSSAAKPEQNTLILRDIASSTPSGDVLQIFSSAVNADGTPCPAVQSVRADMNDTWFVTFATESDAKAALSALRECKFQDKPVRARLKTESTIKSFYSAPGSSGSTSNKGDGSFSPHHRGASAAPSPTAAGQSTYSPAPHAGGHLQAQPQGAFFGAYPVPPPHPGAPAPAPQGPPSAYANVVFGRDGKPAFAPPGQLVYGHAGQPPFADPHLAGYNSATHHAQQYGNPRRGNRHSGYVNNPGYNNTRGGQAGGGYRHPGGRGQRPAYQYQYQPQHHAQHMPMAGYMQAMPPLVQVPPSASQGDAGAPAPEATGDGTPRSGGGSTTMDGSSPDDSGTGASVTTGTGAAVTATGDQQLVSDDPAGPSSQHGGPPGQNPPLGHVGPYVNYAPPGPASAYFPNFAFNGAPLPYQGFPNGPPLGPGALSPLNFPPGSVPPQGFFQLPMSPMHQVPQHVAFPNQFPHGNSPRHQQGHIGGDRQQGHPRQHGGGSPRGAYNGHAHGQGAQLPGQGGPQQQHYQHGARGAGHRNGVDAQPGAPTATAAAPSNGDATEGDSAAQTTPSHTERKTGATGNNGKANRERKSSNSGATVEDKDQSTRPARTGGADASEAPATGEIPTNTNRRRLNSANSEGASSRKPSAGGEAAGGRRPAQKGEKGGERSAAGEKKKGGREKGRGERGEQTAPAMKRADFNLEADFPTLVEGDAADKIHAAAVPKPAAFDYANAAKKASQSALAPAAGAAPTVEAAATTTASKGAKKHADKKASEHEADTTAQSVAPVTQDSAAQQASPAETSSTPATTSPPSSASPSQPSRASGTAVPSPSAAISAPAVESFTFGSVVAPVVTTTDKAAMHFGTASATRGVGSEGVVTQQAAAAAAPQESASKPAAASAASAATPAAPAAQASAPAADIGKTVAWGTKKSFADILQQSDRA